LRYHIEKELCTCQDLS